MKVEVVVDAKATLGEGPVWDWRSQRLYWVDIEGHRLHVLDPSRGEDRVIDVGQPIGAVAVRRSGGLVVAVKEGLAFFDAETAELRVIARPEAHLPKNRFNDAKCDPAGRFWAGTMGPDRGQSALYCLEPDLSLNRKVDGATISNGIAWSLDGSTMYYIDTPTQMVVAYDYRKETGAITNRRVIIEVPAEAGAPDGMTIDEEGKLWIALWDGGRVVRWDPATGKELAEVKVPVTRPTSCTFGGPNLDVLYITSARSGLREEELSAQPLAGALFCCRPSVRGLAAVDFEG